MTEPSLHDHLWWLIKGALNSFDDLSPDDAIELSRFELTKALTLLDATDKPVRAPTRQTTDSLDTSFNEE